MVGGPQGIFQQGFLFGRKCHPFEGSTVFLSCGDRAGLIEDRRIYLGKALNGLGVFQVKLFLTENAQHVPHGKRGRQSNGAGTRDAASTAVKTFSALLGSTSNQNAVAIKAMVKTEILKRFPILSVKVWNLLALSVEKIELPQSWVR